MNVFFTFHVFETTILFNMDNNNQVELFIPFVQRGISPTFISNAFEKQLFGKIIEINLHDKKIKTNKNTLRSAKHNYAFIKIRLYDTTAGNNLRQNIGNNQNTYMMCEYQQHVIHWQVKPYLNVQDRMERGFELHIKNEVETKEDLPEWYDYPVNVMSNFFEEQKGNLHLILPQHDILPILHSGEMGPRSKSFFDKYLEKQRIASDYRDIEKSIDIERVNYQKMLETV